MIEQAIRSISAGAPGRRRRPRQRHEPAAVRSARLAHWRADPERLDRVLQLYHQLFTQRWGRRNWESYRLESIGELSAAMLEAERFLAEYGHWRE